MTRGQGPLMTDTPEITMSEEREPEALAKGRERDRQFERNLACFLANAAELYQTQRGRVVCVAGGEWFAADSAIDALATARQAHPADEGLFTRVIPRERSARIYNLVRSVASVR